MKSLKREIRRLLSLFVVAAMIVVSVPQEYLTVRAAEISGDGTELGAAKAVSGAEIPEENGQPASGSSETDTGQDQPVAESSEADTEQRQPETEPSKADTEQSQPETEPSEAEKTEAADVDQKTDTGGSGAAEGEITPETPDDGDGIMTADPDETDATEETDSETTTEGAEKEETEKEETEKEETETPETEASETEEDETERDGTEKAADKEESKAEESADVRAAGAGGVPEVDRNQKLASGYGYTVTVSSTGFLSAVENKNVEWFLDTNGTLEVMGTGDICRGSSITPPWFSHRKDIKAARINLKGATYADLLFDGCDALTNIDLSEFDTSNVTTMRGMFEGCKSLASSELNACLAELVTENVTDMSYMFKGCSSLTNLDLSGWSTDKVGVVIGMFSGCSALESLDLSNFKLAEVTDDCGDWLTGLDALESIMCPANLEKGGISLPSRDGISWRCPDGTKVTVLLTNSAEPVAISRNQMAGIEFQGENFTLQDTEGSPIDLVGSSVSGSMGEKIVDLGDAESFLFTVVPDTGYTMKNAEFVSGDASTLVLEKGAKPDQYIISPLDKESGYTCDEILYLELIPVANFQLSVTYDKNINDAIVRNGTTEQKNKPVSVQVSNDKETSLYVKIDNTGKTDTQEAILYLTSGSQEKQLVTRCQDTADMSDAEKALAGQGYDIFRLGSLHEDTTVSVTSRYSTSGDEIASGKDGDINWVIDGNGRLKIKGMGNLENTYMGYPAWHEYREQIKTAVVDWTGATSITSLFNDCTNLEEVDVSGFDISGLTSLSNMFNGCVSLKYLDLSSWDFENITIIYYGLFYDCISLTEIKTPRNVKLSVPLPNIVNNMNTWRLPDGTAITELPQNRADSIVIDNKRAAIIFRGENYTLKDADGKTIVGKPYDDGNTIKTELLVAKGTKETVPFTVEASEGYVVRSVRMEENGYAHTVTVTAGTVSGQYTISPLDMEKGFETDDTVRIETTAAQNYTMDINYFECAENIADVIIVNGDAQKQGRPTSVTFSNAYDTNIYLKLGEIGKPGTWFPKISVRTTNENGYDNYQTLMPQNNTDSMSAGEKELSQQGYHIFHLGRLFSNAYVTVELTTFYQVQFKAEGFPGNVRIVKYVEDGIDSFNRRKWRKEEIKDVIEVEKGRELYLQAEWEDTPDQANKWCRTSVLTTPETYVEGISLDGVDGEVQRVRINDNTTIQFTLKPHTISLEYSFGDLVDISTGNGVRLSEDQRFLEIYGGDRVSFGFGLSNGLQLGEVMDNTGVRWSVQESDGRYTVSFQDMAALYNITTVTVTVSDPKNRTSLSDPEANCQVTGIRFNSKGKSPAYTGEPIEAVSLSVSAYVINSDSGRKPRRMKLQKDTDYTVSYINNINAGEAQMIITAVPDHQYFRGSYIYPFTIEKAAPPKELDQTVQVENVGGQYTHQTNLAELFKIEQDGKELVPTGYRLVTPCDKGEVLVQNTEPVLEGNILAYTVREDAGKESAMAHLTVTAAFDNYQDCRLQIHIRVVKKQKLVLGGTVTIADKEYDGMEVSPNTEGLQILSVEGTDSPASAELLNEIKKTLSYHYTGVDGTIYDSDTSPIETGTYRAQVKVSEENLDYKSDYMDIGSFRITQRNVVVIADDVKLYLDDTMPTQYTYHTEGMARGDVISTESFVSCSIQSTAVLAEYPVIVNVSAVKIANRAGKDMTANYIITGQEGKLTVCEPEPGSYIVIYTGIDPLDPLNPQKYIRRSGNEAGKQIEKPFDPAANGYVFLGWFIDEASTKAWNFETDIIQDDLTLYAGWSKHASESGGMTLCVQEIMPQTYTGKAIKPAVTVYAADGEMPLKMKKDYTITYKNNTDADTKAFPNEIPQGGIGETLNDTAQGFNSSLPYVIIKGKGNYAGTVYVNFHINPADIAAASGYSMKYTDQFEEKPGKYAAVVTQFKYKNKKLSYDKDYTLIVHKIDSGEPVLVTLDSRGQLPLTKGTYQATIVGKDNFTGEMVITEKDPLRVADKSRLFKNAKVTCRSSISDVTKEKLEAGVQPEDLAVKMNGSEIAQTDYIVECTDNHAVGTATVTVRPTEGSGYVGSKSVTFQIKGTAFKENAVSMSGWQDVMTYTGKALTQNKVVLTGNGKELVYGTDYTISYKNNIKNGNATMVFMAKPSSGYSGSFSKKFKITPMDLATAVNEGEIVINGAEKIGSGWKLPESVSYQKSGAAPADRVSLELAVTGCVLKTGKGGDYTVKYTNNKDVSNGSAYMTLKGTGNFAGSIDIYFDITKASLSQLYQEGRATITSAAVKVPYTHNRYYEDYGDGEGEWVEGDLKDPDSEFKPAIIIKDGNTVLKKDVDFTVIYSGNTRGELEGGNVLNATIKGIGNYGGDEEEITLDVTVNRTPLSAAKVTVSYVDECTYTGEPVMPEVEEVSYKISNGRGREDDEDYEPPEWVSLTQEADYRVEYTKNITKGTGTIKIIGIGAYTGSVSKTFKINCKEIYQSFRQSDSSGSGEEKK